MTRRLVTEDEARLAGEVMREWREDRGGPCETPLTEGLGHSESVPNAALSLEASAEAYLICGDEVSAAFCRRMADDARNLGSIGEALYRHWASEQAVRATAKLQAFNERRAA